MKTQKLLKKIEEILKNGNIEEYKAEAKLIILSTTKLPMEKIVLDEVIEDDIFQKATKFNENETFNFLFLKTMIGSYFSSFCLRGPGIILSKLNQ